MNYSSRIGKRRVGQVAPLVAMLIVPLMGMLAYSGDIGYLVVVRTQLQNAADAAALAGAQQLQNPSIQYVTPGNTGQKATILSNAIASAIRTAQSVGAQTYAGGVSITIPNADVTVGYTAPDGTFYGIGALPTDAFPNTVKVTAKRTSAQNAEVDTFFGKVLGKSSVPMEAKAAAVNYTVTVLDGPSAPPVAMLPMTFDKLMYDQFVSTGTLPNNDLLTGTDGNRQIQLYPSIRDTGNFGQLSLNDLSNNSNDIRNWVHNGLSQADVNAIYNSGLVPLTAHDATQWDWEGTPGFRSSTVADLNESYIPGKAYLLPLFTPRVSWSGDGSTYEAGIGQGQNYNYNISGFASVILKSDPTDNKVVIVEPSAITLDYTKILVVGGLNVGGQPGTTISNSVFIAPRLTE